MTKEENWEKVEAPVKEEEEKIEVEIEKDDATPSSVEPKAEAPAEKELEGIETKGAQKRIRQLVRQRKERDEQIQQLIQQKKE